MKIAPDLIYCTCLQIFESRQPLRIGFYVHDGYLPCIPAVERTMDLAKSALQRKGHTVRHLIITYTRYCKIHEILPLYI